MRQHLVRRLTKFFTALSILAVAGAPLAAFAHTSMAVSDTHKSIAFVGNSVWAGVAVALLAVAIFCDWAVAASATASTDATTEAPVEAGGKAKAQVPAAANAHTSLPISTGAAKQELEKHASSAAAQEGKERAQPVHSTAKP